MTSDRLQTQLCDALQSDASLRQLGWDDFLSRLAKLAEIDGRETAAVWALRAVSPLLDYSSLMRLRRWASGGPAAQTPLRLAVLGGPTTVQLRQLIELFLAADGIAVQVYECDFGLFRQEVITPGSGLDRFAPQVVLFATSARDVARLPALGDEPRNVAEMAQRELDAWRLLWDTAHTRWQATVIQNNFEIRSGTALGHYGLRHAAAGENYLDRLNRLFADEAPNYVVLHDLRGLAAEAGAKSWFDPRWRLEFKLPCGAECLPSYAYSVASLIRAIVGRSKKALVLDLDNTLWGGVVGDLGAGGIQLGQGAGVGEAFLAFQAYAKSLAERGVVLAVCSKNDPERAREPFEKRQDMILRLSDISAFVANWENKADNLRAIAASLELNTDALVFVDDNPAERALVRRFLPEVATPDLPDDPAGYIDAVSRYRYFETVSFTREDLARGRSYAANAQRRELLVRSGDLATFLASLEMRSRVGPIDPWNLERATQLINKSNQFNLTTRRYTVGEIRELADAADWRTLTFTLSDTLGDNGLISVILARRLARALVIDTWVMSCRVLQRGVERLARNELVELARREGCDEIRGSYLRTAKNSLVENHYAELGFAAEDTDGERSIWSLNIRPGLEPLGHSIRKENGDE